MLYSSFAFAWCGIELHVTKKDPEKAPKYLYTVLLVRYEESRAATFLCCVKLDPAFVASSTVVLEEIRNFIAVFSQNSNCFQKFGGSEAFSGNKKGLTRLEEQREGNSRRRTPLSPHCF